MAATTQATFNNTNTDTSRTSATTTLPTITAGQLVCVWVYCLSGTRYFTCSSSGSGSHTVLDRAVKAAGGYSQHLYAWVSDGTDSGATLTNALWDGGVAASTAATYFHIIGIVVDPGGASVSIGPHVSKTTTPNDSTSGMSKTTTATAASADHTIELQFAANIEDFTGATGTTSWSQPAGLTLAKTQMANAVGPRGLSGAIAVKYTEITSGTAVGSRTWSHDNTAAGGTATLLVSLATNTAPVVNCGPDITAEAYTEVTITATAIDPEGNDLSGWDWSILSGPTTTLTENNNEVTFTVPASLTEQTMVLQLSVSDGTLTGTDTVSVTIPAWPEAYMASGMWHPQPPAVNL